MHHTYAHIYIHLLNWAYKCLTFPQARPLHVYIYMYTVDPLYPTTSTDQSLPYIDHFIGVPSGRSYNNTVTIF